MYVIFSLTIIQSQKCTVLNIVLSISLSTQVNSKIDDKPVAQFDSCAL